jgi:hypothetical protein
MEVEISPEIYAEVKKRADAVEISVQDYIEQALEFAFKAEDLPDEAWPSAA